VGEIAFLFAGQGGQDGPTSQVQPAIVAESLEHARALVEKGIKPDVLAGFSLGEITALRFAGVFTDNEIVKVRAGAMQDCCEKTNGTMVAVVRLDKIVEFKGAWPVNFNSPEQIVYSMDAGIVDDFIAEVGRQGGRAIKLKVSGAFHSSLMKDASEKVARYLESIELNEPQIPVYSNITAKPYQGDAKFLIANQIISPVQWQKTIENMITDGVDTFIECGPGNVLCGLVTKIAQNRGVLDKIKIHKAEEMK
jgi:[acyl-carrier-protein] S-malonyltransferase